MKLFIIAILCCISLYLGYLFSKKYKQRVLFFHAIVMFCQKFDVEINYSKERIKNIVLSLDEKHKNKLYGLDKNFLSYLNQEAQLSKEVLFKNISFLKNDEKDLLFMFFKSLGRSDLDSQSKEIKNFLSRFEDISQTTESENKKYGSLSIKLGVIASLFIIILFI